MEASRDHTRPHAPGRRFGGRAVRPHLRGHQHTDAQEFALAKAEASQTAKKAGTGAGMLGGAAWAANFVLLFASIALWWWIGTMIGDGDAQPALGWSALIVTVLWAIIAAVLGLKGKKEIQSAEGLPRTAATMKKIPDALKGQE